MVKNDAPRASISHANTKDGIIAVFLLLLSTRAILNGMTRRKSTPEHIKGIDRDHELYYRGEWTSCPNARRLRNTQWLIPYLDREVHEAKHDAVAFVPPLGRFALALVVRDYEPTPNDYIASLDGLIKTISDVSHVGKIPLDERRYAEFTIDALERQRPFIVEGLVIVQK